MLLPYPYKSIYGIVTNLATMSVMKSFSALLPGCGSAPPALLHRPDAARCFIDTCKF